MLAVEHLQSAYGPAQVLFDIGFKVGAGEMVTLLGRNGMGKTATIQTIMGLLPATGGSAGFDDPSLLGPPPPPIAPAGLRAPPPGRRKFSPPPPAGKPQPARGPPLPAPPRAR